MELFCVFFFQAEDGIRDDLVTGVQTCALPIYFWSASRARTFLELTLGDCGAKSKTRKPLIERVGRGVVNARRTSSDTAFPRARERLAAYRFTRRKMSSSRESVVLIVLMMHWMQI